MALAVWIVGAWVVLVFFGTWAVQIAAWIAVVAFRLLVLLLKLAGGLFCLAAWFVVDRRAAMAALRRGGGQPTRISAAG